MTITWINRVFLVIKNFFLLNFIMGATFLFFKWYELTYKTKNCFTDSETPPIEARYLETFFFVFIKMMAPTAIILTTLYLLYYLFSRVNGKTPKID